MTVKILIKRSVTDGSIEKLDYLLNRQPVAASCQ